MTTVIYHQGKLYSDTLCTLTKKDNAGKRYTSKTIKVKKYLKNKNGSIIAWSGEYVLGLKLLPLYVLNLPYFLFPRFYVAGYDDFSSTTIMHINENKSKVFVLEIKGNPIFKIFKHYFIHLKFTKKEYEIKDSKYYTIGSGTEYAQEWVNLYLSEFNGSDWPAEAIRYAATFDECTGEEVEIVQVKEESVS